MCDVCIVGTHDGQDWSSYLKNVFTEPDESNNISEPFNVHIYLINKEGSLQMVNPQSDDDQLNQNQATGKFLLVVVTPGLIKMMHEFKNLGFRNYDQAVTKKALFLCGIEPVQLFETDDSGRTLSERFMDYTSWTKYSHGNHDKLVDSAVAWIRFSEPVIPARNDIKKQNNVYKAKCNHTDDDDDDDEDNKYDYVKMHINASDEDKSSSKTSSKNIRNSNSSDEIGDYITPEDFNPIPSNGGLDTYGIGPTRTSSCMSSPEPKWDSSGQTEFTLIPSEAACEDNTTVVVVFRQPPQENIKDEKYRNNFKVAMNDYNCTIYLELKWMNPTVAYFVAPTHHPGTVQVKIARDSEDKLESVSVDLEYKRSHGVEELVSEISQIYIHLLSVSFNIIKLSGQSLGSTSSPLSSGSNSASRGSMLTPFPQICQLDKNLSSVFKDSSDVDQFNVRAFEYFFGAFSQPSDVYTVHLPTAFHLVAKHNLPQLATVLLGLPDSDIALSIQNSSKMTPVDMARSLGNMEVAAIFEEFINSGDKVLDTQERGDDEEKDQYIDKDKSNDKTSQINATTVGCDQCEIDNDDPFLKGALDKGQEELINIMDLYKSQQITLKETHTLFNEWKLRYEGQVKHKHVQEDLLESKGIKKFLKILFGSNKKNSIDSSKRQISRNSGPNDGKLPSIPPRAISLNERSKHPNVPQPPRSKTNADYLQLLGNDDGGYLSTMDSQMDEDSEPLPERPPRRKANLKDTRQSSFPTHLSPPPPITYPRKCSLPESVNRKRILFNSRLDSTTEMSESTSRLDIEKGGHGYVSMSKGKSDRN